MSAGSSREERGERGWGLERRQIKGPPESLLRWKWIDIFARIPSGVVLQDKYVSFGGHMMTDAEHPCLLRV